MHESTKCRNETVFERFHEELKGMVGQGSQQSGFSQQVLILLVFAAETPQELHHLTAKLSMLVVGLELVSRVGKHQQQGLKKNRSAF
jgi:hypothetical protein